LWFERLVEEDKRFIKGNKIFDEKGKNLWIKYEMLGEEGFYEFCSGFVVVRERSSHEY
jgi:hypothetical protein